MNKNEDLKKIIFKKALAAGILAGAGVALSFVSIPVGPTRCFPFQHSINVIAGVLLGPFWAVGAAFTTSLIRNLIGTGSLFAFPGSMFGAFLVGLAARCLHRRHKLFSALAEPVGTGILGAWVSAAIVAPLTGASVSFAFFSFSFLISSLPGAAIGAAVLYSLEKRSVISRFEDIMI
ncbi:MAG: energy coupling factor transporter S component ThiW [Synergistota bacterium]|nr:energy coupling factor transporter S component ThiW [Synergistota bacterium]